MTAIDPTNDRVFVAINHAIHSLEDERNYLLNHRGPDLDTVAETLELVERSLHGARVLIERSKPVLAGVTVISAEGTTTGDLMPDDSIRLGAIGLLQQAEARAQEREEASDE